MLAVQIIVTIIIAWGLYLTFKSDGDTSQWDDEDES